METFKDLIVLSLILAKAVLVGIIIGYSLCWNKIWNKIPFEKGGVEWKPQSQP